MARRIPPLQHYAPLRLQHAWKNKVRQRAKDWGWPWDRRPFGDWHKSRGILLEPLPHHVATDGAYYLVTTERTHSLQRVRKFRSWLIALCAKFNKPHE